MRVKRVLSTSKDGPTVADAPAFLWAAYAMRQSLGTLPEWHELSRRHQRFLEIAHYADVLGKQEFEQKKQIANDAEKHVFEQILVLTGGETAESLFKTLGWYYVDLSAFDEVVMPDILVWLRNRAPRDPAIWHEMPKLNWDYEAEIYEILRWIVEQPECDAATAIDILHLMGPDTTMDKATGGTRWLFGKNDFDPSMSDEVQVLATICRRSESGSFEGPRLKQDDTNNLSLLKMMRGVQAEIETDGRVLPFPLPEKLLSAPVPTDILTRHPPVKVNDDRVWIPKA